MAKRIPDDVIDNIRNQVDITNIIGQYVDLQKRGKNHFGFCPFHDERTPSFSVNDDKQFYHCFSCGRGGNVFNFLMELEGFNFPESVEKVAELGNVATDFDFSDDLNTRKVSRYQPEQERVIAIHRELTTLYHYILMNTEAGQPALNYLLDRGLSEETLKAYEIGIAPEDSQLTYKHLVNKHFELSAIEASGVFSIHGEQAYDRFSSRIVFPLRNEHADVVGFSGRILPESKFAKDHGDAPKYLNSPETIVFEKSQFLFNLDVAKQEVRKAKEVILFEGFMDVIAAAEIGIKNGVASMGTSLTEQHIQMINRITKQVLIIYDGDDPGREATKRAIKKIKRQAPKLSMEVINLPNKLDPDEFIQKYGDEKFIEQISDDRLSTWRFYRIYFRKKFDVSSDQGKLQYINALLQVIANTDNELQRELYLQEVAEDTHINIQTLNQQLKVERQQIQGDDSTPMTNQQNSFNEPSQNLFGQRTQDSYIKPLTLTERSERQLFNRFLYEPSSWFMVKQQVATFHFQTPILQTLFLLLQEFREQQDDDQPIAVDRFLQLLRGEEEQRLLVQIMSLDLPPQVSEQEIHDLLYNILTKSDLTAQMEVLNREVEMAKLNHDNARISDLNKQRIDILRQMKKRK